MKGRLKVFSRDALERFVLRNGRQRDAVLVSINDPGSLLPPKHVFSGFERSFLAFFHDVTSDRYPDYRPISSEQAEDLVRFVLENRDRGFFVHCHAGISRSPAVALAVRCILDYDGDHERMFAEADSLTVALCSYPHHPNWFVFETLVKAYENLRGLDPKRNPSPGF